MLSAHTEALRENRFKAAEAKVAEPAEPARTSASV